MYIYICVPIYCVMFVLSYCLFPSICSHLLISQETNVICSHVLCIYTYTYVHGCIYGYCRRGICSWLYITNFRVKMRFLYDLTPVHKTHCNQLQQTATNCRTMQNTANRRNVQTTSCDILLLPHHAQKRNIPK